MLVKIIIYFYDSDMQHLLVHIEELSQSLNMDIEWYCTGIRRTIET